MAAAGSMAVTGGPVFLDTGVSPGLCCHSEREITFTLPNCNFNKSCEN